MGNWSQVATSLSTKLFGTGIKFRNVSADYQLINKNNISVVNCGLDDDKIILQFMGILILRGPSILKEKYILKVFHLMVPIGLSNWVQLKTDDINIQLSPDLCLRG